MVYVVERYLPGLSRANLLPRLSRLEPVTKDLREKGIEVRYLGSTIVLEDEACFRQFESSSETAVAEANRSADLPFHRIVPALVVQPNYRSAEMSVSTSIPKPARRRQSHSPAAIAAIMVVSALALVIIVSQLVGSITRPERSGLPPDASVLRSLTPPERQYVLGILSLTPAQLQAALGTSPTSVPGAASGSAPASTTTSPSVATPILPACGQGPCWHAATGRPGPAPHRR